MRWIATGPQRLCQPGQQRAVFFPSYSAARSMWGATTITRQMEIATVHAIAELARQEQSDIVAAAYGRHGGFGIWPGLSHPEAV